MAELLIRVRDKETHPDPYIDVRREKRGDVIAVCPDGWKWSERERTNPEWRIVRIPGLPDDEAQMFVSAEPGDRRTNPMLRNRANSFDIDSPLIPSAARAILDDDSRTQSRAVLSAVIGRQLRKAKPPAVDPAVIG